MKSYVIITIRPKVWIQNKYAGAAFFAAWQWKISVAKGSGIEPTFYIE